MFNTQLLCLCYLLLPCLLQTAATFTVAQRVTVTDADTTNAPVHMDMDIKNGLQMALHLASALVCVTAGAYCMLFCFLFLW